MKNKTLIKVRKQKKITQSMMATQAGISEVSYQRIEYGTQVPSLFTAFKIADILDSTVDELFRHNLKKV